MEAGDGQTLRARRLGQLRLLRGPLPLLLESLYLLITPDGIGVAWCLAGWASVRWLRPCWSTHRSVRDCSSWPTRLSPAGVRDFVSELGARSGAHRDYVRGSRGSGRVRRHNAVTGAPLDLVRRTPELGI